MKSFFKAKVKCNIECKKQVPKMIEGLTGLERHEVIIDHFNFWVNYPFKEGSYLFIYINNYFYLK